MTQASIARKAITPMTIRATTTPAAYDGQTPAHPELRGCPAHAPFRHESPGGHCRRARSITARHRDDLAPADPPRDRRAAGHRGPARGGLAAGLGRPRAAPPAAAFLRRQPLLAAQVLARVRRRADR